MIDDIIYLVYTQIKNIHYVICSLFVFACSCIQHDITMSVSYKKQEQFAFEKTWAHRGFFCGVCVAHFFSFSVLISVGRRSVFCLLYCLSLD